MILRSPVGALLWENWRLTRAEAAQRLAIGTIAGSGVFIAFGASQAFWLLVVVHAFFYMSIAKLNGGRFLDGYKPGFPLYLLYTRPVSTTTFVGVAMAYDALTGAAMYLATAALLSQVFGQPLPLFSMAFVILVYHLAYLCVQWSNQSRTVQWIGSVVITLPGFLLLQEHAATPADLTLSPEAILILLIFAVTSVALTIAGVARQRHGEALAARAPDTQSAGYPAWLLGLFRLDCPTFSRTHAQVWFELRSSGLPSLAIGAGLAILISALFAVAIHIEFARYLAVSAVVIVAPMLVILLGGNAFGIRRRQGRTYASAFEVTQPFRTANQAGIKLLVRTVCVLTALLLVGVSVWFSTALIQQWGSWLVEGGKDAVPGLLKARAHVTGGLAQMPASALLVFGVITVTAVTVAIAIFATFAALKARYRREVLIASGALLFHGLVLVMLGIGEQGGLVSGSLLRMGFVATGWTLVTAMLLATLYLLWRGFAERILTSGYGTVAAVCSAAFGAAWLTVLVKSGVPLGGMSLAGIVGVVWPVLLPPLVAVAAPWSLSRLRHV